MTKQKFTTDFLFSRPQLTPEGLSVEAKKSRKNLSLILAKMADDDHFSPTVSGWLKPLVLKYGGEWE